MQKLLMVFGPSGCGKDTLALEFLKAGYQRLHPIADLKAFLAEVMGYEADKLDTPEREELINKLWQNKQLIAKAMEFAEARYSPYHSKKDTEELAVGFTRMLLSLAGEETVGEVMRKAYFESKRFDEQFSLPYVKKFLNEAEGNVLALALRNQHEIDWILSPIVGSKFVRYAVWVDRPGYIGLDTDYMQSDLYKQVCKRCREAVELRNDASLPEWLEKARWLLKRVEYDKI